MQGLPQIRLRTIFFWFVCAAVGLAIGTSPKNASAPAFSIFGWENADLHWHYALLAAALVAVIAGLWNEIGQLRKWRPPDGFDRHSLSFARRFAMAWRWAIIVLLVACLVMAMLLSQRVVSLPETETFFSYEPFPYAVAVLCLVVVLSASVARLRSSSRARSSLPQTIAVWLAGILLAAVILCVTTMIHFLVHIATTGIERAQPASHHWPGAFPDHQAEGFRTFWVSTAAAAVVLVGAASLVAVNWQRGKQRRGILLGASAFALSLAAATAFVVWYHGFELHRISPYLASVGVASGPLEWFAGICLAATLITVGAHRLTVSDDHTFSIPLPVGKERKRPSTYESAGCLLLLTGAVIMYFAEAVGTYLDLTRGWFWSPRTAEFLVGMVHEPGVLLLIGVLLLSVQIGVLRWRRRSEPPTWNLAPIEPQRFVWNWIALALLACVAIPTLSAFLFAFWLGPWYLYGP